LGALRALHSSFSVVHWQIITGNLSVGKFYTTVVVWQLVVINGAVATR
jgi:hypothetical protein